MTIKEFNQLLWRYFIIKASVIKIKDQSFKAKNS